MSVGELAGSGSQTTSVIRGFAEIRNRQVFTNQP